MNPVLLKPEHDTGSQVVVLGAVRPDLAQVPWRQRSELLWPHARTALHSLLAEHDVVVIEGAGSPAEINLHANDFVNMRTAREAHAACLLVTDIDRGGAFAHLFGTHQLLPADERALIKGFVLNRFRGDATLLAPGPAQLQEMTGVPTVATLPLWREHGLPEEDGLFDDRAWGAHTGVGTRIAIVAFPRLSNLDEFQPLRRCPTVELRWARSPADLIDADWIILPGSKNTRGDRAWMRAQGLDAGIIRHAGEGGRVLGICGGLQMLGRQLLDPQGVDGGGADAEDRGLDLLPLITHFETAKLLRHTTARFAEMDGAWKALSGLSFDGYEIRHGRTVPVEEPVTIALRNETDDAIGWRKGNVVGLCAHGLFESPAAVRALFGVAAPPLDSVFDGLADFIDRHFVPGALSDLIRSLPVPGKTR